MATSESTSTSTSESNTFQIWGRTYITDDYGDPIKSDDTDSISSIQIALTNSKYTGDVPTSVTEGQRLLATLIQTNFELDAHVIGYPERHLEKIREQEPSCTWKAEIFWAFWYNRQ